MNAASQLPPILSAAILSPHRDDAAFSCGLLMTLLLRRSVPVTIVNIFTTSAYAPLASTSAAAADITHMRRSEDEAVLRRLGPGAHMLDLAQIDAPLRLHISELDVLTDPLPAHQFEDEVHRLAPLLASLASFDLVLLPLALGNHIDHRIAREAGRLIAAPVHTAFYEDLPYAARFGENAPQAIRNHLANLPPLHPLDLPHPDAAALKHELASLYPSQIPPEVATQIAHYAASLGGAERLHAPSNLVQRLQSTLFPDPPDRTS